MTLFKYRAYTDQGDLREGEIEALSLESASESLWSRGLTPFETREAAATRSKWWQWEVPGTRGPKLKDIATFTRQLATLEQAEIPIDDGLRILTKQTASPVMGRLAGRLLSLVMDGVTLSDAMERPPTPFSGEYINVVRAGESGATLARVLSELADMLERRLALQAKLRSALIYPAILVIMAILSTAIVIGFLVPSVAPIFADSGKPMPGGLRLIIDLENNWMPVAIGFVVAVFLIWRLYRAALIRPNTREILDRFRLKLPLIGSFTAKRETARFMRTLGTLIRAGVPLVQALLSARAVVANAHLGTGLDKAVDAVRDGESLARALEDVDGMPQAALQMIVVGEETRKVDHMLLRAAVMFETETEQQIERTMGLLTPALTIAIAAIVGGLILAVMNAILAMNELATQ